MALCAAWTLWPRERLAAKLDRQQVAVAAEDLAQRQPPLAPPRHVRRIAEGADHQDARSLLGIDELAREDGHRDAEERRQRAAAQEAAVALIGRMRGDPHARRQQLRARRRDDE
jgi:hypothetical protein